MEELNVFQKNFMEGLANIQNVCVQKALCKNNSVWKMYFMM